MVFLLYPYVYETVWHLYFFEHEQVDEDEVMNIEEENAITHLQNLIRILITEVKLTFIYIIVALITTCTLNTAPITRMRLNLWLIEGFYAPISVFVLWYLGYLYQSGQHIYVYNSTCYIQFTSTIKLIIFVFVRYMEYYPLSVLNNRPIKLFYRFCNKSSENPLLDYIHQVSLNDNKTSIL